MTRKTWRLSVAVHRVVFVKIQVFSHSVLAIDVDGFVDFVVTPVQPVGTAGKADLLLKDGDAANRWRL